MARVELRVLGPVEVATEGGAVALPARRERLVLAALAARAPEAVPAARLLEDVWDGRPPDGARGTLRSYVSTLRRALRAGGVDGLVVTHRDGYAIAPDAAERIDARAFAALVSDAERHRVAGDRTREAVALRAALALWRGPAFAEVAQAPGVAPHAARLEEARLAALERRVEADLACGRHAELAVELATLCEQHLGRERLWAARMLALYRCGRQVEALATYRRLWRRLDERLGLAPSADLRALELAILRQDPSLAPSSGGAAALGGGERVAPTTPLALPLALRASPRALFVGRRDEVAALEACWSVALSGRGQLAIVTGEPGIGKTALAGEWARRAHARGATVLHARCDRDRHAPYQPFADALASLGGGLPAIPPPDPVDPSAARGRLFDAVAGELLAAAAHRPLALVLDDVHWADASTLQLVRHVARRAVAAPLMLVLSCRDGEEASDRAALANALGELRRDPGLTTLALRGLEPGEVAALAEDAGPLPAHADGGSFAATLHRATDGNPLFVRQMLAHVAAAPEAFLDARGRLRPDAPLPAGVRDVIARRLELLPDAARRVLATAAVAGAELDVALLEAVDPGRDAVAAVELAERARLVVPLAGGRFVFAHELIRRALLDHLSAARRARLHERIAGALAARPDASERHLAAIAEHFAAAARPGRTGDAARAAARAARQALDRLAYEEARGHAERGLRCVALDEPSPDRGRRCVLRLLLAEACLFTRDIAGCKAAAALAGEDARALGEPALLGRAAELAAFLNVVGQPDAGTVALCEDALAVLDERAYRVRVVNVLAGYADHAAFAEGDGARAIELSGRALALARRGGDPAARARALFVRAEALGWTPRVPERIALAEELIALGRAQRDARVEADGHHHRALARLERGDRAGFDADLARVDALRPRAAYWYLDMYAALWHAMRPLHDGRLDDAERLAGELLAQAGRSGNEPNVANLYVGLVFWLRRAQGRSGELRQLLLDALAANPSIAAFRCGLALVQLDLGELDAAAGQLDVLARDGFAALPRDLTWTMSLCALGEVAAAVGDRERARELVALLRPYAGLQIVGSKGMVCLGPADLHLARLAAACGDAPAAR